jgi:hypothetical protein
MQNYICCSNTIRENGEAIIKENQEKIEKLKKERVFPFRLRPTGRRLYSRPPTKPLEDLELSEEQIAHMEDIVKDKARKRMEMELGCNIIKFPEEFYPGLYIAMKAPHDAPEPFLLHRFFKTLKKKEK